MHGGELLSTDLRDRASVKESLIGCAVLIGVAGGCWVLSAVRMEGMDAGPAGYLGATGWFMATWITMMAAMMLPVIAPVALAPDEPGSNSAPAGRVAQSTTFLPGLGYSWLSLSVWRSRRRPCPGSRSRGPERRTRR